MIPDCAEMENKSWQKIRSQKAGYVAVRGIYVHYSNCGGIISNTPGEKDLSFGFSQQ